jgi:hypothetical protein
VRELTDEEQQLIKQRGHQATMLGVGNQLISFEPRSHARGVSAEMDRVLRDEVERQIREVIDRAIDEANKKPTAQRLKAKCMTTIRIKPRIRRY